VTPEGKLLKRFLAWLDLRGIPYIRLALQPGVKTGWPDVEVLLRGGRPIFIEFKRPGVTKPRVTQAARRAELEACDYEVLVTDSFDEAVAAVTCAVDARRLSASRS
jgi:hypothetical protein